MGPIWALMTLAGILWIAGGIIQGLEDFDMPTPSETVDTAPTHFQKYIVPVLRRSPSYLIVKWLTGTDEKKV